MNLALQDNYLKTSFNVAIYLRLSREDENGGQSESIRNQKDFLVQHVHKQGWSIYDIYIDDGYTGTNFDRPDFQRMLTDIEAKRVNLVITKDQSRLGRELSDTVNYIEKYFPSKNVRYIAVNDGVDTFANNSNNDMIGFRSAMNDMYSRDISRKVRTAKSTKVAKGEYIGAFPLYGYQKDPNNKNRLIIDSETAPIIKRIFEMYVSGRGVHWIALTLQEEGILTPTEYKLEKYPNFRNTTQKFHSWSHVTVSKIIRNPTYCGNLTQNFVTKVNYKIKNLKLNNPNDWVTVNGTHEPIISPELFEMAQLIRSKRTPRGCVENRREHLLSGLLYCGDCGEKITFQKHVRGMTYTICTKYKRFMREKLCTTHTMPEQIIESFVVSDLKRIAKNYIKKDRLSKISDDNKKIIGTDKLEKEISSVNSEIAKTDNRLKSLYDDKADGLLSRDDYKKYYDSYNKEKETLHIKLNNLLKRKERNTTTPSDDSILEVIEKFTSFEKIDRNLILKLVDMIEIFDDKRIVLHYKFKEPI